MFDVTALAADEPRRRRQATATEAVSADQKIFHLIFTPPILVRLDDNSEVTRALDGVFTEVTNNCFQVIRRSTAHLSMLN